MTTVYDIEQVLDSLQRDKEVTIKAVDKQKVVYPPYMVVGNGRHSKRYGVKSMDIIDVCAQLNTSENKVLKFFRDCFTDNTINNEEYPNIVVPSSWKEYDTYIKKSLEKNYTHMEYLGVLKRVKRGIYMINPYLFMPRRDALVKSQIKWEEIGGMIPTVEDDSNDVV